MAVPSASGSGIVNKGTTYGASSQVTSTNINAHVDDAVFNANAVDGTTINADTNGKNLFVVNGSISVAKTSFLGTVDTTADSNVKILSKQSDGQYDSVTPSGDVTMSQAGAFTIASNAIETSMITDSNVTLAKIANIADDRVLGNVSGGSAAPSELTAANLVTLLGTNLINPTSVGASTNTITFSNGLIAKFGLETGISSGISNPRINFSDYGGSFPTATLFVTAISAATSSSFPSGDSGIIIYEVDETGFRYSRQKTGSDGSGGAAYFLALGY